MQEQARPDWDQPPIGKYIFLKPSDFKGTTSFRSGQPIVGTYYFYWYDVHTKEHFINPDGSDALTTHPLDTTDYSYRSVRWHRQQMEEIRSAGIDFILPVYWGNPGDRQPGKPLSWSFVGIKTLVEAQQQMRQARKKSPKIGLFYDTTTLQHNALSYHADLRTEEGRRWFYLSIRDFFSLVPPVLWAMINGRPLIFLYAAAFAKGWDQAAFDYVYQAFEREFGRKPYIVREISWHGVQTDNDFAWGGALEPKIYGVAAIGPGYDHSAVPGRKPLVREREGGAFYERAWQQILRIPPEKRPSIVMIETWNEFHEGTDIAPSKEYGRQYVQLTAKYAALFHQRAYLP